MPTRAAQTTEPSEADAPETAAVAPPGLGLSPSGLLALQRSAGNAAVRALLQRAPATAAPPAEAAGITTLRKLLSADDANGAIAHMGRMSPDEAAWALGKGDLRSLAVKVFDDEQMAHAMYALKGGSLVQKLNWMVVEGSSLKLVRPLLDKAASTEADRLDVYQHNYLRSFFIKLCDDDEMEEVVKLLGGTLEAQLNWMFNEGTSVKAVRRRIADHKPALRPAIYQHDYLRDHFTSLLDNDEMASMVDLIGGTLNQKLKWMAQEGSNFDAVAARIRVASDADLGTVDADAREAMQSDFSAKSWRRVEPMLGRGLLHTQEVDSARKEPHWEKKDYTDPTSPWYVETYTVESKYQLEFSRTELRVRVRIKFTGITPTAAHLKIWRDGIHAVWKDKFHLENDDGKKLAIVFDPVFNASDPHHTIKLVPPIPDAAGRLVKGRADAGKWYAGPNANSIAPEDTTNGLSAAHEFGHLVGLTDEYQLAKADYERIVGPAPAAVEPPGGFTSHTIMGDKTGGVTERHLKGFAKWLNDRRRPGEKEYRIVAGPP